MSDEIKQDEEFTAAGAATATARLNIASRR